MFSKAIKTESLTKVFKVGFWGRKVTALKQLNLEIRKGEIFGFIGPNGAGKTTTLKILMGLIYPSDGKAWLMERELGDISVKKKIGFLPENPYFYDHLTGREFLHFYGQLLNMNKNERKIKIRKLFSIVGLKGAEGLQLRRYSKGMTQRIGIAQALLNDPELVIFDEPMSGLDPIGRKEVRDIILQLRDEGKTVFFSTHILSDVEMICDRVGILIGGRLRLVGNLEDLLGSHIKNIEITAKGLPDEALKEIPFVERVSMRDGSLLLILEKEEDAEKVVDLIQRNGGKLCSLIPNRDSLEEYFMKEASKT